MERRAWGQEEAGARTYEHGHHVQKDISRSISEPKKTKRIGGSFDKVCVPVMRTGVACGAKPGAAPVQCTSLLQHHCDKHTMHASCALRPGAACRAAGSPRAGRWHGSAQGMAPPNQSAVLN